jgi:hypothetical protein
MSHHDSKDSPRNQAERFVQAQYRRDVYERAVRCAHFRPVETCIIQHVMENGWYKPFFYMGKGPTPVTVSCSEIGSETPFARSDLQRALKRLTEWGVLIVQDNGGFLANKEWQSWSRDGKNPIIQLRCYRYIEEARLPHDCPMPLESLRIDQVESNGVGTWNHTAEPADAIGAILNGSGACDAGVTPPPPNCDAGVTPTPLNCDAGVTDKPLPVTPVSQAAMEPADHRNGTIERARVARFVDEDLSSSSLPSYRNSQPFSSSQYIYKSSVMEDTTGNPETYIYQKKDNLACSSDRNGLKSACMEPTPTANPAVEADPVSSLESPPAAPSTNGIMPASMLEEIPGPEAPDDALWIELKYMCDRFFPGCDFDLQFARWRRVFPTAVMVGAFKRCFVKNIIGKHNIMHAFSYVLKVMQSWNGPGIEAGFDRNMHKITVAESETPQPGPEVESTNADPHAEFRANHNPAMLLEWMKDNNVSMENNPPKKDSPNGKLMDENDYNRRLSIRARDPDRFRKLAMGKYCPSLILENES